MSFGFTFVINSPPPDLYLSIRKPTISSTGYTAVQWVSIPVKQGITRSFIYLNNLEGYWSNTPFIQGAVIEEAQTFSVTESPKGQVTINNTLTSHAQTGGLSQAFGLPPALVIIEAPFAITQVPAFPPGTSTFNVEDRLIVSFSKVGGYGVILDQDPASPYIVLNLWAGAHPTIVFESGFWTQQPIEIPRAAPAAPSVQSEFGFILSGKVPTYALSNFLAANVKDAVNIVQGSSTPQSRYTVDFFSQSDIIKTVLGLKDKWIEWTVTKVISEDHEEIKGRRVKILEVIPIPLPPPGPGPVVRA